MSPNSALVNAVSKLNHDGLATFMYCGLQDPAGAITSTSVHPDTTSICPEGLYGDVLLELRQFYECSLNYTYASKRLGRQSRRAFNLLIPISCRLNIIP